jgi:selenocysteine lyase
MAPPVYLDHNATTPLAPEVVAAVTAALQLWGNPSSPYASGRRAAEAVALARERVAGMVGAEPQEITFTSGGTEANHLALWSALAAHRRRGAVPAGRGCPGAGPACHPATTGLPHIVTSNVEHPAIDLPLRRLQEEGLAKVTRVPVVPGTGRVTVPAMLEAVGPDTCLVTLMLANNETGVLQPVAELFKALQASRRAASQADASSPLPLLHTDAAQAVGKVPVAVGELGADMLTLAGHKFYGPRVGALCHRVPLTPMLYGGGQEGGRRPGTENTPMVVGLGVAAGLVAAGLASHMEHMAGVRDYLREELIRRFQLVTGEEVQGPLAAGQLSWRMVDRHCLPNTLSVRWVGQKRASHTSPGSEAAPARSC